MDPTVERVRPPAFEDGLGIDQVVLSSVYYLNAAPGAINSDSTILPQTP